MSRQACSATLAATRSSSLSLDFCSSKKSSHLRRSLRLILRLRLRLGLNSSVGSLAGSSNLSGEPVGGSTHSSGE
eukprot:13413361-Heterocapsa_arctica.AAC.1